MRKNNCWPWGAGGAGEEEEEGLAGVEKEQGKKATRKKAFRTNNLPP